MTTSFCEPLKPGTMDQVMICEQLRAALADDGV